jgi:hypothetical protein
LALDSYLAFGVWNAIVLRGMNAVKKSPPDLFRRAFLFVSMRLLKPTVYSRQAALPKM